MPTRLILLVMLLLCPLSQAAPADIAEGREPQLAPGPDHHVYLTYGRANEIHFADSPDSGRTFTPGAATPATVLTQKLDTDSWKLNACPMDGGALTTNTNGNKVAVWQNNGNIHLSYGKMTPEKCLGQGVQPTLTTLPAGPAIAWTTSRTGQLLYLPPNGSPLPIADHATNPVLITSENHPICAWSANNRILVDVLPPVPSN